LKWTEENKGIVRYLAFITLIALLIAYMMPTEINWTPSFENDEEDPFGSLILYEELDEIFPGQEIKVNAEPFYNGIGQSNYKNHNLIVVDKSFQPDSLERAQLYNFVRSGNNAFIAAAEMSHKFQDSLKFWTDFHFFDFDVWADRREGDQSYLNFYGETKQDSAYTTRTENYSQYFIDEFEKGNYTIDSLNAHVAGISKISYFNKSEDDSDSLTNFVRIQYGGGNFFLHLLPYAFTNYAMLEDNTNEYVSQCLSYLPQQSTIWDEYYKPRSIAGGAGASPLNIVLGSPALKWAYWLAFSTLLLFMIFYAKRRQRVIPVIKPYENSSLDFTQTVASLYFQRHNNADLAQKKARYFRDYVSRKFYLKHFTVDDRGLKELLGKSSYDREQLLDLFNWVNKSNQEKVSDRELIEISKRLNHFYRDN